MNAPSRSATFDERLRRAHLALRAGQAASAERALRALAAEQPSDVNCQWLLGAALLAQDRSAAALETLAQVLAAAPEFAEARVDLARAYRTAGNAARAREEVRWVLEREPHHHRAWLAYGDALVDLGQLTDAATAFERARLTDPHRGRIEEATAALTAGERRKSEDIFREILRADPSHIAALCGLAAHSLATDVPEDAERLLRHALAQSAHTPLAWRGLGEALIALGRLAEADAAARHATQIEPDNPYTWIAVATVATRFMRLEQALEAYERAARLLPEELRLRTSLGHVHKTLGSRAKSEAAYKEALALDPGLAEAWWSLADLKTYVFDDAEVAAMERALTDGKRSRPETAQLHFALGRALEQRREYRDAFAHYARGNTLRRLDAPFDMGRFEARCARIRAFFDLRFFAERAGSGDPSRAPIFIVGLPRSGSTLIEQILASHSQVEGTMELPNILMITRELDALAPDRNGYPETLRHMPGTQLTALGSRYLAQTAPLRHGHERFTDKLPNNFSHIGLIHAVLPQATVIDARRHPMDACFGTFKQHFAIGQTFSYDLEDLGRYYRCYLSLMDHWDAVLPGKVLHFRYEELVRNPEPSIRRLLEHCRLPFEPACLAFHETRRSVRTASAEQVRQPLYTSGVGHWRHFEKELEPLRRALGDCLERFE
ncbi:MAG TPA: sulfotransferase [Steroidobacteraceae bacterium]|jgi:tetratricopeptide (TPR) repeat protein